VKRLVIATIVASILAVPAAQAQQRPSQHNNQQGFHNVQRGHHVQRPAPRVVIRHHAQRPVQAKPRWVRGQRVPHWQQRQVVRDYHRHGLRRPGHGQQWVKVDNNFLLVSLASGIIAGLIAAR
jgi:Ni/Co efflux regulator RcnB